MSGCPVGTLLPTASSCFIDPGEPLLESAAWPADTGLPAGPGRQVPGRHT
ncbi:hypothetical protein SAMN05661080_00171 [Modestobacter sp. DSM 44400]|nr:hypothetical protein SAMN05661080_00171 [Modestobacter sp. DSM 44400]